MVELARAALSAEPAITGPGVTIRLIDPASLHYVTGGAMPPPNTVHGTDPATMWLAPDRALVAGFAAPAQPEGGFVSEVTDGLAVFDIAGTCAADIIAMGCTLYPRGPALEQGRCAQTMFGGVKVLLHRTSDGFRMYAERSLCAFLRAWFEDSVGALA